MPRTFVAVEIDAAIRAKAVELIGILRAAGADVKWVESHNLHLTLQFLGNVPDEMVADVCLAVEKGAAQVQGFELEVGGVRAFPNSSKPRTVWIGAGSGSEQMANLHEFVALALSELGFQDEERKFQTHLTIGRTRSGKNVLQLGQLLKQNAKFIAGPMQVKHVTVFSSRLERGGPVYEILSKANLREAPL